MSDTIKNIKKVILEWLEDILIFGGLILINVATFNLNVNAGLYGLGVTLLGLGIYFARNPIRKGDK